MLKVVHAPGHLAHDTSKLSIHGQPFFEVPARAEILREALAKSGWCALQEPREFGSAPLEAVHGRDYLEFLATISEAGRQFRTRKTMRPSWVTRLRLKMRAMGLRTPGR